MEVKWALAPIYEIFKHARRKSADEDLVNIVLSFMVRIRGISDYHRDSFSPPKMQIMFSSCVSCFFGNM